MYKGGRRVEKGSGGGVKGSEVKDGKEGGGRGESERVRAVCYLRMVPCRGFSDA